MPLQVRCLEAAQIAGGQMLPASYGWKAEQHGTWQVIDGTMEWFGKPVPNIVFTGTHAEATRYVERRARAVLKAAGQ